MVAAPSPLVLARSLAFYRTDASGCTKLLLRHTSLKAVGLLRGGFRPNIVFGTVQVDSSTDVVNGVWQLHRFHLKAIDLNFGHLLGISWYPHLTACGLASHFAPLHLQSMLLLKQLLEMLIVEVKADRGLMRGVRTLVRTTSLMDPRCHGFHEVPLITS